MSRPNAGSIGGSQVDNPEVRWARTSARDGLEVTAPMLFFPCDPVDAQCLMSCR